MMMILIPAVFYRPKHPLVTALHTWASTYTKKWGGPNRKIIGSKKLFLKPSKTSKVQILGVLVVFICPAIYSTNQI